MRERKDGLGDGDGEGLAIEVTSDTRGEGGR